MPKKIVDTASFQVESNKEEFVELLRRVTDNILTEWGLIGERYAKGKCPVDTGRLRNSITWAISGGTTAITTYQGSDTHGSNESTVKRGIAGKPAPPPHEGSYSGTAPDAPDNKKSVYIGTNVKYAPYVELGTRKMGARPFIKPAVADHLDEYTDILRKYLNGAGGNTSGTTSGTS